jgi:DNA-binding HxlR family transcriptional regulator
MKQHLRGTRDRLKAAESLCEALSDEDEKLTRELLTSIADKWSLWTLSVLHNAGGPIRFTRVMEQVECVSQKSLTKTLRQLEREGLVTRRLFPQVPPRVEYSITASGIDLLRHVEPLWRWVADRVGEFKIARESFDHQKADAAIPALDQNLPQKVPSKSH